MKKKMFVGCIVFILMICSATINILAHSVEVEDGDDTVFNNYGGESFGWIIKSDFHNANKYIDFKYDSKDSCFKNQFYKDIVIYGAAKWDPCGKISYNKDSNNKIKTVNDKNTEYTAMVDFRKRVWDI